MNAHRAARARARVALIAATLVAGACATLPTDIEPPRVTLRNLTVVDMTLFEQRYRMSLRVQNPNDVPLPIRGMDYTLELNGREFAQGVSAAPVEVPAYGEAIMEVEMVSTLVQVFGQLRDWERGRSPGLRYRLSGRVRVEGFPARVPFDYSGELLPPARERGVRGRTGTPGRGRASG